MFKFYNIKKIKIILAFLSFTKYIAWCGFFIFQGRAIQQSIDKNIVVDQLLFTLFWFVLTKLIVMVSDLLTHFFTSYFENKEVDKQWKENFPKKLFRDNENKSNLVYLMYFDYIPALFHLECDILTNKCTMLSVITIVIPLLIYTGFYYGIVALLAIFILSFTSKSVFLKKLDSHYKETNSNKTQTLSWINQFFRSYREISFNWHGQTNGWINFMHASLYQSKKKQVYTQLKRDVLSQFLVEIPFIFNTLMVILAVYGGYLSITQLFVWIGFSQFVISATNAFLENKVNSDKRVTLIEQLMGISDVFKVSEEVFEQSESSVKNIQIKLQDNTINDLSLDPTIHHIQGKNGSGKSTLLNIIMGYERQAKVDNHRSLLSLFQKVSASNIRIIEREPEIFSVFTTFNEQILGPEQSKLFHWVRLLHEKMDGVLSSNLINDLKYFFVIVEQKFYKRANGHFSSGEKVLISLLRALTSWNTNVRILITDECVAFLDFKSKKLFFRCLLELSERIPIFISSHESINFEKLHSVPDELL